MAEAVIWTTKDGEKIDIHDMTDSHISNTVAYLKRRKRLYREAADRWDSLNFQGEMATMEADRNVSICDAIANQAARWIKILKEEQKRRGLIP